MPNLNYAQVWEPELLEILMQGTLTSPFVTTNVKWLDAKTFHFTQMSTSGYKNHSRSGGWNKGNYVQKDVPFIVTHDRDIAFLVDKADVDETNSTASIQNISRNFEQMHCSSPRWHRQRRKKKVIILLLQFPDIPKQRYSGC